MYEYNDFLNLNTIKQFTFNTHVTSRRLVPTCTYLHTIEMNLLQTTLVDRYFTKLNSKISSLKRRIIFRDERALRVSSRVSDEIFKSCAFHARRDKVSFVRRVDLEFISSTTKRYDEVLPKPTRQTKLQQRGIIYRCGSAFRVK